ncbi:heterokaryon incompatibility protein-domain-containing protein [Dactylonectria estremocensis]|uniref:Heterokaryon incompatibility protein-domain-containing protein n=1 Tax=Dactylonectria estremocensis TaxID=1079267 RepID=A0A9P9E6D1_9HYPO|nr:heterokaryon incompatibility protein-domain-containing protein [Dactylonectria estremocensis]
MRLLDVSTLEFKTFTGEVGEGIPLYAILSHTWGSNEVSYADHIVRESNNTCHEGYEKIHGLCRAAKSEGFQYAWIDTCCIDKLSSAELSEAINSMFQWYRDAAICFAYLSDVDSLDDPASEGSSFSRSRWFTRGWTLQELLAPTEVAFLASDWAEIGTKNSLRAAVSRITGISAKVLEESKWSEYSVAQRMSWAAKRQTTRPEDEAYCLMGLFDVNMPLLYGEGRKAFLRLQQGILSQLDDQSLFAWSYPKEWFQHTQISGLLAPSPELFKDSSQIEVMPPEGEYENPFQIVNQLVRIRLKLVDDVKAVKLRMLATKPLCATVLDIQSQGRKAGDVESASVSSAVLDPNRPTVEETPNTPLVAPAATVYDVVPRIHFENELAVPTFSFNLVGDDQETPSTIPPEKLEENSWTIGSSEHFTETEAATRKLAALGDVADPGNWFSYIYQPVLIMPLRCQVAGRQLGIVLTKGSTAHTGSQVLSRLHNPSLLTVEGIRRSWLSPPVTRYVVTTVAPRPQEHNVLAFGQRGQFERHRAWPEIRIARILSRGYRVYDYCGPGWAVDRSHASVVQDPEFRSRHSLSDHTSLAPLVLFLHGSGNEATNPTFFVSSLVNRPKYLGGALSCEVGVYDSKIVQIQNYKLYSLDLAKDLRAMVPLGKGLAVVVNYRRGPHLEFLSVSIQQVAMGRDRLEQESEDSIKKEWISSRLFPILGRKWVRNAISKGATDSPSLNAKDF